MSLFIGKNNDGTPLVHITSDTREASSLKTAPIGTSVFHSDLGYLSYTVYSPIMTTFIPDYKVSSSYYPGGLVIEMPAEFYAKFSVYTNRCYFILLDDSDSGLNVYHYNLGTKPPNDLPPQIAWYSFIPTATTNNGLYEGELPYPTSVNRYGYINTKVNTANVKLIVTNYADATIIEKNKTSNSISISNESFTVGGVDISRYPYITRHIINNIDTSIVLNNEVYQLCNSNSTGSFALISNPNIQLKVGDKVIADSRYKNNLQSQTMSALVYYNLDVGNSIQVVAEALNYKDLVAIEYTTAYILSTGQRLYSRYLISYVEGKVIPIVRTNRTSVDFVCTGNKLYLRFNAFWTSHYDNFIGIKYRLFN